MKFDRVLTDLKYTCNQLIRQSSTEQFQYLAFARCKRFIWQRSIDVSCLKLPKNVGAALALTSIGFFNSGRGHVPALGVFVVFDGPFPFAFSSSSQLKVWAVSEAP